MVGLKLGWESRHSGTIRLRICPRVHVLTLAHHIKIRIWNHLRYEKERVYTI
jgi:hypothetical protein